MPFDAEEIRSLIESRLADAGVNVSSFGTELALDIGQRIQGIASKILDQVTQQAVAIKVDEVLSETGKARRLEPSADAHESFAKIRHAIDAIEAGKTQVDILKALLVGCADFCSRVALFIVKGDKGIGWLAQGFGATPPFTDESLKRVSVPLTAGTFFRNVFGASVTFHGPGESVGDNGKFFERIGGFAPREVLAVPLCIKGKVVAILYGDGGSEVSEIRAPDVVASLVAVAAMSIKLIPLKARPEESGDSSGKFVTPDSSGSFRRPEPELARAVPTPTPEPAPRPSTAAFRAAPVAVTPSVSQARPASPAPVAALAPAPVVNVPPEEKKLHDDARRFARLLVSEIKLYNEAKVAVGRRNKDLYERLKEDIERSRQMYNERYPAKVTSTTNYFFEELVTQLADGDRSALGI